MYKHIDFIFEKPSSLRKADDYVRLTKTNPETLCFFGYINFQCVVSFDKRYKKYCLKFRGFDSFSSTNWDKWNIYNMYETFEEAKLYFRSFIQEFFSRSHIFFEGFEKVSENVLPF